MNKERFLQLAKETEKMHEELKAKYSELKTAMESLGLNSYVQDPETLVVYKIYQPTGTYVEFRGIDYKRTSLPGEKGGQVLAKKEAEEQGFILK